MEDEGKGRGIGGKEKAEEQPKETDPQTQNGKAER